MRVEPSSKRTVRLVFGVTALWIALLQYIFLAVARAEPYPALILPGFPASCAGCLLETGEPASKEPDLLLRLADGRRQQIPMETILPPGPSVRLMAFSAAFEDDSLKSDPAVIAWLESRVAERYPGRAIVGLDIVWRSATYGAASAESIDYAPMYTIHLDFDVPA